MVDVASEKACCEAQLAHYLTNVEAGGARDSHWVVYVQSRIARS